MRPQCLKPVSRTMAKETKKESSEKTEVSQEAFIG